MAGNNGLTDLGKESAICGAIAAGTFEIVPEHDLIPVDAFCDPRWKIIYSAALALRARISDQIVCAESVNDYIAFHGIDRELQNAIDSAKITAWQRWPEFADASQAFSPDGLSLRYSLSELRNLYFRRQEKSIRRQFFEDEISLQETVDAWQAIQNSNGPKPIFPLIDFQSIPPDPAKTLLGNRFLCREGGMLFIGPSGIGKSSASIQQDLLWSIGAPAFGIKPAHALRILTIQAEDDPGDLSEMVQGVSKALSFTSEQIEISRTNCFYVAEKARTGESFLSDVVRPLCAKLRPDLLRINPLQAYIGGDIKDPALSASFLRNGINPILEEFALGFILVHHTPKTNFRTTEDWKASDWMYAGAGSADITNWARAIVVMDPTEDPKIFRFIAAKRGSRVGWANDNGERIAIKYFSHANSNDIHWQEVDESEVPHTSKNTQGQFHAKFTPTHILDVMSAIDPMTTESIRKQLESETGMSRATFFRLWNPLKKTSKITPKGNQWLRS